MSQFIDLQLFSTEKREPATPRRRQMARERGQVSMSQDLASAAGFLAAVLALRYSLLPVARFITARAQAIWSAPLPAEPSVGWAMSIIRSVFTYASLACAPVMAAALFFGAGAFAVQTGFAFRANLLVPNFSRINPATGLARLFSKRALVDCLKALIKVGLVGILTWGALKAALPQMSSLLVRGISNSLEITRTTLDNLVLNCSIFLVGTGVLDWIYQWWENEKSMMMTTKEVRDEIRDNEVKPEVKSAIRSRQRQMARRRMMQDVPGADVVVVNPTHFAVALKYDAAEKPAPVVVAKGMDDIALRIRAIAEEAGVKIVENPPLARALYKASEVGEMVPQELYKAVAEVLAYVYRVSGRVPREARTV